MEINLEYRVRMSTQLCHSTVLKEESDSAANNDSAEPLADPAEAAESGNIDFRADAPEEIVDQDRLKEALHSNEGVNDSFSSPIHNGAICENDRF